MECGPAPSPLSIRADRAAGRGAGLGFSLAAAAPGELDSGDHSLDHPHGGIFGAQSRAQGCCRSATDRDLPRPDRQSRRRAFRRGAALRQGELLELDLGCARGVRRRDPSNGTIRGRDGRRPPTSASGSQMRHRRTFRSGLLVATLALVAAGCGNGTDNSRDDDGGPTGPPPPPPPPPPPSGLTLTVASGGNNVPDRYTSDLWVHGSHAYTGTWGGSERGGNAGNALKIWSLDGTGAP